MSFISKVKWTLSSFVMTLFEGLKGGKGNGDLKKSSYVCSRKFLKIDKTN